MRDKVYRRNFSTTQQRNLALLLRNVVVDDCSDDDLLFIIHIILYGTKIILTDIDLTDLDLTNLDLTDISIHPNLIKDIVIYNEKLHPKEQSQVHDKLHILRSLLFQPHKIVPKLGYFEIVSIHTSSSIPVHDSLHKSSEQNTTSNDAIQPSIWKLHATDMERMLHDFYLDRDLVIEACIYVSVLCGKYDVNRARTVSMYAQILELSAYQLSSLESMVFRRLHEKGIEIQLQNSEENNNLRKSDERSEIISALGDSIHENILWEGDKSEFVLINSDSDMSFSDSSSMMIRRRRNIQPKVDVQKQDKPKHVFLNTSIDSQKDGLNGVDKQKNPSEQQPQKPQSYSRRQSGIAALWESDSEIITRIQDGNSMGIHQNQLQKKDLVINEKNSISDKFEEDDETDLFER
jgi:hypothetical protein